AGTSASGNATLKIADAPLTAAATPVTTAVEGRTFTGEVATFTDANTQAPLSDFPPANVTIQWGDGVTTSAASITQDLTRVFHVFGTHTYLMHGTPASSIRVTVKDIGGAISNATSYQPTIKAVPTITWSNPTDIAFGTP